MQNHNVEVYRPQLQSLVVGDMRIFYTWMAWTRQTAMQRLHAMYEGLVVYRGLVFMLDLWVPLTPGQPRLLDLYPMSICCDSPLTGDKSGVEVCSECGEEAIRGHSVGSVSLDEGGMGQEGAAYLEDWLALKLNLDPLTAAVEARDMASLVMRLSQPSSPVPRGYADLLYRPFASQLRTFAKMGHGV